MFRWSVQRLTLSHQLVITGPVVLQDEAPDSGECNG